MGSQGVGHNCDFHFHYSHLTSLLALKYYCILIFSSLSDHAFLNSLMGFFFCLTTGFSGGSVVESLPAKAGDAGDTGLIPGSGRSSGVGNGNPLQYSCLWNPMDTGTWRATVQRVPKSRTRLSDWAPTSYTWLGGSCSLIKDSTRALKWKHQVLTTGLPENSLGSFFDSFHLLPFPFAILECLPNTLRIKSKLHCHLSSMEAGFSVSISISKSNNKL